MSASDALQLSSLVRGKQLAVRKRKAALAKLANSWSNLRKIVWKARLFLLTLCLSIVGTALCVQFFSRESTAQPQPPDPVQLFQQKFIPPEAAPGAEVGINLKLSSSLSTTN